MLSRNLLIGLLGVSFLGNAFLIYRLVDMGVTVTHGEEESGRRNEQVRVVEELLAVFMSKPSKAELIEAAKESHFDVLDKGEDGIYVGEVRFNFSEDKLASLSLN